MRTSKTCHNYDSINTVKRRGTRSIHDGNSMLVLEAHKNDHRMNPLDTYVEYLNRLWRETSPEERRMNPKVAIERFMENVEGIKRKGVGQVNGSNDGEHSGEELAYSSDGDDKYLEIKEHLRNDCREMLAYLEEVEESNAHASDASDKVEESKQKVVSKKGKKTRSISFGAAMGALVTCWVFSGNYIFAMLFACMTLLGQLEYYRMVMKAGIYPARRISCVGSVAMFITALVAPNMHQICLPVFATGSMIWFLTMRRNISTISEISTTLTGMTYLGYIPSFWVRIRSIGGNTIPTKLAPLVAPMLEFLGKKSSNLPSFIPKSIYLPITEGSVFIFWTWLCIAFSDVGAYFTGINFGKTKLGEIAPAAGATSPNKTVEGVIGGCAISAILATCGAWVQNWPHWWITGPIHGVMLGFLGLVGDLTASMIKRDAKIKDFGDLLPEHGGIMDRVDSYIFTAPYSWLVISYILPFLKYGKKFAFNYGV